MESNSNFCDVFLRIFLNLNKVAENKEQLMQLFLQKIHKSINDFLKNNDYLKISEGEKFDVCNIIPIHMTNINEKNNYKKMINNFYENEKNNIYNKIIIFDYGFDNSYIYKKFENITMSFSKIEYYKNIQQGFINNELKDEIALKKKYLFKRIKNIYQIKKFL